MFDGSDRSREINTGQQVFVLRFAEIIEDQRKPGIGAANISNQLRRFFGGICHELAFALPA